MTTITTINGTSATKNIEDNKEAKVLLLTTRMNNKTVKVFRVEDEEGGLSLSTEVEEIELQRRKSFKLHRDDGTKINIEIAFSELQDDYTAFVVDELWHSFYLKKTKVARSLAEKIEASLLQPHSFEALKKAIADKQGKEVVEALLQNAKTLYDVEIRSQASYLEDFLKDGITLEAFTEALRGELAKHEDNLNTAAIEEANKYLASLPKAKGKKA